MAGKSLLIVFSHSGEYSWAEKKTKSKRFWEITFFLSSLRVIVAFYCSTSLTFMNFSLTTIISDISPTTMQTEMKNVTLYLLITGKSPENHSFFFSWNEFDPLTVFHFVNSLIFFLKKKISNQNTHPNHACIHINLSIRQNFGPFWSRHQVNIRDKLKTKMRMEFENAGYYRHHTFLSASLESTK